MYENKTSEVLLEEMMDDIDQLPREEFGELDKQELSLIYMSLAPLSKKLSDAYVQLDQVLKLAFASTSEGEYLEYRTDESGVNKKAAVATVREGIFNIPVEIGKRFFVDDVYYFVSEVGGVTKLTCEEAGTIGNKPSVGSVLLSLDNIDGLQSAILGEILINGEDTEAEKDLFNRFKDKVSKPSTSANPNHYLQWAKDVPGIRTARVFPCWQGRGTVRVVIVDSNGRAPTLEKAQEVKDYILSQQPFDAEVTVDPATEVTINFVADVNLQAGVEIQLVSDSFLQDIAELFNESAFVLNTVRYSQTSSMILDQAGVVDYQNFTLNSQTSNIILEDDQIAVPGVVNFNGI